MAILFEQDLEGNGPRELSNYVLAKNVGVAAIFAQTAENNYRYVIGSKKGDVRPFAKVLNEMFQGRGGGKPEMVQGSVAGTETEIKEAVEACVKKFLSDTIG